MKSELEECRVKGKTTKVRCIRIADKEVMITGKWAKTAVIKDEELYEKRAVESAEIFVRLLRQSAVKADIFSFAQKPAEREPKFDYYMELDNSAVIPIKDFSDWWEDRLSQDTRRNVRKAAKLGVAVKIVPFNEELIRGIMEIYNETSVRQGRPFWHFGKSVEEVTNETATYLDRSEFIGAFHKDELIGFIKLIYVDCYARVIHILSKEEHLEKRVNNALIAKAVEICAQKGLSYLVYCKYIYGKNDKSPLTEFKRRNGFEQMLHPRYFVPLTLKGRIILGLRLHRGLSGVLPSNLLSFLSGLRTRFFEFSERRRRTATARALPEAGALKSSNPLH